MVERDDGGMWRLIADRGRVDGSALLFQANFMGSNQSAAPDIDRATAICWEISPLIGPTKKGHHRSTATCSWLLLPPCITHWTGSQACQSITTMTARCGETRKNTGLPVSDYYFMTLEQCVLVLKWKKKTATIRWVFCQSVRLEDDSSVCVCVHNNQGEWEALFWNAL